MPHSAIFVIQSLGLLAGITAGNTVIIILSAIIKLCIAETAAIQYVENAVQLNKMFQVMAFIATCFRYQFIPLGFLHYKEGVRICKTCKHQLTPKPNLKEVIVLKKYLHLPILLLNSDIIYIQCGTRV